MKIYELDDEIVVDRIPHVFDPNQKIFLTTLVHIEAPHLPKIFPKIYTSEELKKQFTLFLSNRGIEIEDENFHVWKPFEPEIITLSNGNSYEVLPCCPQDISTNILLVFRQGCTITHIYVGLCSELKSTLLNKTLISWLRGSSMKTALYIPYNKASKRCVECEFRNAIAQIERKVNADNTGKLLLQLPFFGSEPFIAKVSSEFRGHVALCGLLKELYTILPRAERQYFTEDLNLARIIITGGDTIEYLSKSFERVCEMIIDKCTIKWSPLPTPNILNLLSDLVRPKRVYGITFKNPYAILEQPVQVLSLRSSPNEESVRKFILSRSVGEEQCCLENFQKINQQVFDNVKSILKSLSREQNNEVLIKQEDITQESSSRSQLDRSNRLLTDSNIKNAVQVQVSKLKNSQEHFENQCESKVVDRNKENRTEIVQNLTQTHQESDNASKLAINLQNETSDHPPAKKVCCKVGATTSKTTPTNAEQDKIRKTTICQSTNTLVYRKGKKGIKFVDDDSSSTD